MCISNRHWLGNTLGIRADAWFFVCVLCRFVSARRSLFLRAVWCVVCVFPTALGDETSYSGCRDVFCGRRASPTFARARAGNPHRRVVFFVCVFRVSCVRRVASRRLFIASFVRSFVRFPFRALFHARRHEWTRHRPVDHRRSRSTSSFGRVKIVSRRSIVARSSARRCTSPRARIAAAVGARDRANPSVEGTSSREIRAWISSA